MFNKNSLSKSARTDTFKKLKMSAQGSKTRDQKKQQNRGARQKA